MPGARGQDAPPKRSARRSACARCSRRCRAESSSSTTAGASRSANRVAGEILGAELVGESWQRVVREVLKSPTSADGDWLTRDGRRIALAASSLPQESVKIILLTDVTETRALQELAARNQRLSAIGKMAASLAHQIRTPLAGALLYLSQCRSRRDERERAKLLEKGIERLRHLDLLVQDMLVFARGKGPGERVRVADLFRAVHDAAMAVKPPKAHLVIHGSDVLVELDGNRTALTAALTNSSTTRSKLRPTSSSRCRPSCAATASSSRSATTAPVSRRACNRACSSRSSRRVPRARGSAWPSSRRWPMRTAANLALHSEQGAARASISTCRAARPSSRSPRGATAAREVA